MHLINATEVRKKWSEFIDVVVRKHPVSFKRNRDVLTILSMEHVDAMLSKYDFTMNLFHEEDGTITATLEEIDIAVNAPTIEDVHKQLLTDIVQYALDYMEDFEMYFHAPNRKAHFPYVYKILLSENDVDKLKDMIVVKK
jgi:hypothetical protein